MKTTPQPANRLRHYYAAWRPAPSPALNAPGRRRCPGRNWTFESCTGAGIRSISETHSC